MTAQLLPLDARPPKNLVGRRFQQWTILAFAGRKRYKSGTVLLWRCRCRCGRERRIRQVHLVKRKTVRCSTCNGRKAARIHGYSGTPEYKAWREMSRKKDSKVFPKWLVMDKGKGFKAFLNCVGYRPSEYHKLKRLNPNLGWAPKNVEWIDCTPKTYLLEGESYTVSELAWIAEINVSTMKSRLKTLSPEDAVKCLVAPRSRA